MVHLSGQYPSSRKTSRVPAGSNRLIGSRNPPRTPENEWLLRQLTPGVAGDWISDFIDNGGVSLPLGDRAQEPREANHEADESRPEWNP